MGSETNRIEKRIELRAPRARVWRALSDSEQFGSWFGMRFDGPFAPGAVMRGTMAPTTVDEEIAKMQKPFDGMPFEIVIDRIVPEELFSFRWHPFAIDPKQDYSAEPHTLIVFSLSDSAGGTTLTVTESGFDQIPLARRFEAFNANEGGWAIQVKLVEKFLEQAR